MEMLRIIREDEPPKPSTRLSTTDELAEHRCQPEPGTEEVERPGAGRPGLDRDEGPRKGPHAAIRDGQRLRRRRRSGYLSDELVQARPPSAAYRFHKFARRNRAAITSAAVLALALVFGHGDQHVAGDPATRAEQLAEALLEEETAARNDAEAARRAEADQRQIAEGQRTEAEKMRTQAEANFRKARQAVDEYFTLVSETKLLDVPGLQPCASSCWKRASGLPGLYRSAIV